jgi:hypothetical protein
MPALKFADRFSALAVTAFTLAMGYFSLSLPSACCAKNGSQKIRVGEQRRLAFLFHDRATGTSRIQSFRLTALLNQRSAVAGNTPAVPSLPGMLIHKQPPCSKNPGLRGKCISEVKKIKLVIAGLMLERYFLVL